MLAVVIVSCLYVCMYMYVVVIVLNLSTYIYIFIILEKGFQWYVLAIFLLLGFTTCRRQQRMGERKVVGIVITLGVYIMCHLIGWETNWMRQQISK